MKSARDYGKDAFEKGMKSVPAWDAEFLKVHLTGKQVGEGIEPLTEWAIGWHEANRKEKLKNVLTFSQWLSHECSLTEDALRVLSLEEYGEDADDYIQSKHHAYSDYLQAERGKVKWNQSN
jgi:hypothetical protein